MSKTGLRSYSDDELKAELEDRKSIDKQPPKPLENPDFTLLINTVVDGVARMVEDQYEDDDLKEYIYESAMTCIYGKSFFDWNNRQKWS